MALVSFMSANFVARELGFRMPSWEEGDRSVNDTFSPVETFAERFGGMLDAARELGFEAIDLWEAHLSPRWATDEHLDIATDLLRRRDLRVASLAGWFGSTPDELEASCRIATAVGAPFLGGATKLVETDRPRLLAALEHHELRLAIENHPERTPAEIVAKVGADSAGLIGTTVDTGWWGTQGYDAATAIEELAPHVMHVHLKDVRHAGTPHETCAYGEGVVPLRECVDALRRIGYAGAISVEHEPDDHDPSDEIRRAREMLGGWLSE